MRKSITLLFLAQFLFLQQTTHAQVRYLNEVFQTVAVDSNIVYGSNRNVYTISQSLSLDIYEPEGDTIANRPLVILAHGGSFVGGDRKLPDVVTICKALAKRGYVCASIQYRLGVNILSGNPLGVEFANAVWRGTQDGRAAVRFFRKSASENNPYRIDTANIYMGGVSAGGVLSSHLAFLDRPQELANITIDTSLLGGFDGNSGNPGYSWRVKGIVNLCGALGDVKWMYDNTDVPICNVHGDRDSTVSYSSADFFYLGLRVSYLQGSYSMDSAARLNNMYSQLKTFAGQDHVPFAFDSAYMDTTINVTAEFLYNVISGNIKAGNKEIDNLAPNIYPTPVSHELNVVTSKPTSIEVYNLQGKKIFTSEYNRNNFRIDTKEWDNGLYFVQLGNGQSKKVIVNH